MRKRVIPAFTSTLSKREAILVLLYIPMHVALLQLLLSHLAQIGTLSLPTANLLYYAIGFVYMVAAGFGFLRRDFDPLIDAPFYCLREILRAYLWMMCFNLALGLLLMYVSGEENPTSYVPLKSTSAQAEIQVKR